MPDWLSIHEPVLVNTIGHCAGCVIFGMLLYLFSVNWRRAREERSRLPAIAAALALVWNIGSLVALATGPTGGMAADIIVAASFSVLSLLPAVLLHISLESHHRTLWISGYVLSLTAVALHVVDLITRAPRFHYAALLLITLGFAWLTVIFVILEMRQRNRAAISRLAGAMVLFLFAISFVHFSSETCTPGLVERNCSPPCRHTACAICASARLSFSPTGCILTICGQCVAGSGGAADLHSNRRIT